MRTVALTALITVLLGLAGLLSGLVTIDHLPALHTYGVSMGTSTHYCSAELVNWHPVASCQGGG